MQEPTLYQMMGKEAGPLVYAYQLTEENAQYVAAWLGSKGLLVVPGDHTHIEVETFRGVVAAHPGDYIIKDNLGEIHVRKPNIFERVFVKATGINGHDFQIEAT